MNGATTRRALLKGIGAAAAAAPLVASKLPATPDRKAWDAAMETCRRLEREAEALYERTEAADRVFYAARDKVPHVTVHGADFPISTEDERQVSLARWRMKTLGYLEDLPGNYDSYRAYHRLIEADDARKAEIARLDKMHGWTAAHDAYDAAVDRQVEAERVLLSMPAPDGEALLWKIERLYKPGDGMWAEGLEDQTHADLRHFLSNGRA